MVGQCASTNTSTPYSPDLVYDPQDKGGTSRSNSLLKPLSCGTCHRRNLFVPTPNGTRSFGLEGCSEKHRVGIPVSNISHQKWTRLILECREKARTSFQKNPFFAEWDPRVFQAYIDYALVEFEGGVKLKMSGYQVFPILIACLDHSSP